jgi:hypothetical protein
MKTIILIVCILLFPVLSPATVYYSTDWETGTPDACWPCKTDPCSSVFDGWSAEDGIGGNGTWATCGVSTTRANSGTKSLYMIRNSGDYENCNIYRSLSNYTTIHLRFYLYLTTNWNSSTSSLDGHWIFTNSARSGTGFRLNLVGNGNYNCGDGAAIHMWPEGNGNATWEWAGTGWGGCNINFKNYIGAWHAFEYRMEISGSNVILTEWIDGVLTRGPNTGPGQSGSTFTSIILSGWENNAAAFTGDYYIDDIVVADSYIGLATVVPSSVTGCILSGTSLNK